MSAKTVKYPSSTSVLSPSINSGQVYRRAQSTCPSVRVVFRNVLSTTLEMTGEKLYREPA
ncbi:hypothetical protein IWQ47_001955 [Aquimarina sp. EL_43]|nr:hypothetical protein [Aquimarina sp. EL_35]MBG6148742.1 hypothetical protein [Aquimarina sp. EL_32]MBG6168884.1 hypothetical protein [Aquimarina sp. EL_43]